MTPVSETSYPSVIVQRTLVVTEGRRITLEWTVVKPDSGNEDPEKTSK